jgi:hypothetical protein
MWRQYARAAAAVSTLRRSLCPYRLGGGEAGRVATKVTAVVARAPGWDHC